MASNFENWWHTKDASGVAPADHLHRRSAELGFIAALQEAAPLAKAGEYRPFHGDGRTYSYPPHETVAPLLRDYPHMRPYRVKVAQARKLIEHFRIRGESYHSSVGSLVWVIVAWCKKHNVRYEVECHSTAAEIMGYTVRKVL